MWCKMKQEHIIQIQLIDQEANQLSEQLKLIELNVQEMNELKLSLDEIDNLNDNDKKILTNLGRKIYLPVTINDNKLIVEVGKDNFVKKSIPETKKIINDQIERLNDAKYQIIEMLNNLQTKMDNLISEIEGEQNKSNK